jgi:hypothetical protein
MPADQLRSEQLQQPQPECVNRQHIYRAGTLAYTRRGLVKLFSWLLWGELAWSVRDRSLGEVINVFLKAFEASNTLAAFLLTTLPTILNVIIGPVVSYKSDRHRGRFGRRRPFLFVGVPLCALSITGMAASPWLGKSIHPLLARTWPGWQYNWSVLLVFGICYAILDVASSVSNSVFDAFFNDVVPREVLGRFWGFVRAVSVSVAIIFMGGFLGTHRLAHLPRLRPGPRRLPLLHQTRHLPRLVRRRRRSTLPLHLHQRLACRPSSCVVGSRPIARL